MVEVLGEFVAHELVHVALVMSGGGPAEAHLITSCGGSSGSFESDSARCQLIVADNVSGELRLLTACVECEDFDVSRAKRLKVGLLLDSNDVATVFLGYTYSLVHWAFDDLYFYNVTSRSFWKLERDLVRISEVLWVFCGQNFGY